MRGQAAVVGLIVAVAAAACGSTGPGGGGTAGGGATSQTITLSSVTTGGAYGTGGNYFFSPNPDTASAASPVTFTIGSVQHNVWFDTGPAGAVLPDSIPATVNANNQRSFTTPGTYTFHCNIHHFTGSLVAK
jgi:plastocyanin